jgi:hypothetical protein
MKTVKKQTAIKGIDRSRRQIEVVVTREEVDRDGDVILAAGLNVASFLRNPICLREHDRSKPIGKMVALRMATIDGAPGWLGVIEFLPSGVSGTADETYEMIRAGVLNGVSQGFLIVEADPRAVLAGQTGLTIQKSELLEVSIVALQSCRSCLVREKSHQRQRSGDLALAMETDQLTSMIKSAVVEHLPGKLQRLITHEISTAMNQAMGRID